MVSCYHYNFGPDKVVKDVCDMAILETKMKNYSKCLLPNEKQLVRTMKEIVVNSKNVFLPATFYLT